MNDLAEALQERHHFTMPHVERRFRVLRLVAQLIWFAGVGIIILGLVAGVLLAIFSSVAVVTSPTRSIGIDVGSDPSTVARALALGFGTLFSGLQMMAFAELLEVQISWEESTRVTNVLLAQLFRQRQP